jgi:transcriptional regulator with XRE-family HTH domain
VTTQEQQTAEDERAGQALDVLPDPWEQAGLIPPRRLGSLLSASRAAKGLTLADMALQSNGEFSLSALASIERGTTPVFGPDLERVVELYGLEADSFIPTRSKLVVDMDEGRMWVSETRHRAKVGRQATRSEVLARYLSMVYCMRGIDPGTRVTLRVEDLDVLGASLGTGVGRIVSDLEALMDDPGGQVTWRSRLLKKSVLVPAAGLLVAFCGAGALVLTSGGDAGAAERQPAAPAATSATGEDVGFHAAGDVAGDVRLGPAVVQERNADGTPGPVVDR